MLSHASMQRPYIEIVTAKFGYRCQSQQEVPCEFFFFENVCYYLLKRIFDDE